MLLDYYHYSCRSIYKLLENKSPHFMMYLICLFMCSTYTIFINLYRTKSCLHNALCKTYEIVNKLLLARV